MTTTKICKPALSLPADELRTFRLIASTGSFTKAAKALGITQQAVSSQMKGLEAAIGRRLLSRKKNPVTLTEDGEDLLRFARQLQKISEELHEHFKPNKLKGLVRFGFTEYFSVNGLPLVLAELRRTQRDLELRIEVGRTAYLMERFTAGELDIVLAAQLPDEGNGEPLWQDKLRWAGDISRLADKEAVVPVITYPSPSALRTTLLDALVAAGRKFTVVFESDSRVSLQAAVLTKMGVAAFCTTFDDGRIPQQDQVHLPALGSIEFFLRIQLEASHTVRQVAGILRATARISASK